MPFALSLPKGFDRFSLNGRVVGVGEQDTPRG